MAVPQPNNDRRDAPERLLQRYLAGEAEAFELLVGLYEDRLYVFLARMLGDEHLAEDVFQMVFVKVAKSAEGFDGRASFSTWLFRIARNTALDELRRRRRVRPGIDSEALEQVADANSVAPLDKLATDELAAKMRAALTTLPREQREAFLLKEEGDLDFAEIGEVLGCGRETAKSRFRLAVGKLRACLGMDGDGR